MRPALPKAFPSSVHVKEVIARPQRPLVSIGIPVLNGGRLIGEALECLLNQTYENVEIIISDNNSKDDTAEICVASAENDERITYYRQNNTLSATDNFRFVFERSTGEFFMWAAHDDRWSPNYIEILLQSLLQEKNASLAFPLSGKFHDHRSWRNSQLVTYEFECDPEAEPLHCLVRRNADGQCLHIYGLIRRSALHAYPWPSVQHGPDRAILLYLSLMGRMIKSDGACFYYFVPLTRKTIAQRSRENFNSQPPYFPELRSSWACACVAREVLRGRGYRFRHYAVFVLHVYYRMTRHIRRKFKNRVGPIAGDS